MSITWMAAGGGAPTIFVVGVGVGVGVGAGRRAGESLRSA
jgi:hypothetical protein